MTPDFSFATPAFLTTLANETRAYVEGEVAFWQAQVKTLTEKNVAETEKLVTEVRERFQAAAEANKALATAWWQHGEQALERGVKLATQAFHQPA